MAHGNYGKSKRSVSGRLIKGKGEGGRGKGLGVRGGNGGKGEGGRGKGLGVRGGNGGKGKDFHKKASIRNQIRSIERLLRKNLPHEIRNAQEKKLEELRNLLNFHVKAKLERKMALRYRKVKFFERRKIERRIRRLEKQRLMFENKGQDLEMQGGKMSKQLAQLKEDLEYVRFFPKTEKYISLFMGGDDPEVVANRNKLREMIKANLAAAAASGVDLEETGSDDDGALDISEDDFFLDGSSSDDADADDEWTDKSTRELGSVASGKAVSGMSGDEINKMVKTAHDSKSPKHDSIAAKDSSRKTGSSRINKTQVVRNRSGCGVTLRCGPSSSGGRSKYAERDKSSGYDPSSSSEVLRTKNSSQGGVISSNSDAPVKRRRKRRPKKKH